MEPRNRLTGVIFALVLTLAAAAFVLSRTDQASELGELIRQADGRWLLEPQVGEEGTWCVELDLAQVARERQNFDPAGHYSRPDVTRLEVDRRRQKTVHFED